MGDIVNIKETTDMQLLERFKRLEDIIPECMPNVLINPFIQHIKNRGEVSISLVEFLNHSEFLELLTPGLLLISKALFDKKADTEWYKIMLSIIEEKDDVEAFCENLPLCVEQNIGCELVRDMVEKCNSASEMTALLSMYMKKHSKSDSGSKLSEKVEEGALQVNYYISLCEKQENLISVLTEQIEELKRKEKELSHGLEEAAFHSEFANINVEENCKELEKQQEELKKQYAELKELYDVCCKEKAALSQKSEEEKKLLSVQVEKLENDIECLKMDMESIEKQLQNALKNRQAVHKSYIEEKRTSMRYKIKAEKMESKITDISETRAKCEKLEGEVVRLEEEKAQLEEKMSVITSETEQLRILNNQQEASISELNESIIKRDDEIGRLLAQIKELEEQLNNPKVAATTPVIEDSAWPKRRFIGSEVFLSEPFEETKEEEFPDSKMISFESGVQSVKRKSNWFTKLFAQHSKKAFLKNDRQDQESMIFIKMMELRYSTEKVQKVRNSLSENIPCFDLYQLICSDPSMDELDVFFNKYAQTDAAFA